LAVNLKTLFAALACALLVFSMLGCGMSNKLQTIQLTVPGGTALQGGVYNLKGDGTTLQLKATGAYSDTKTKDLTHEVTWTAIVDPNYTQDAFGNTLLPPCSSPCPVPSQPPYTQGTVEFSVTGLITAVEPATCTWIDSAPVGQTASWFFVGAYQVTATFEGITSQPIYIPIASSAGSNSAGNNPSLQCGP
jgi:hypothetical protein